MRNYEQIQRSSNSEVFAQEGTSRKGTYILKWEEFLYISYFYIMTQRNLYI